MDCRRPSPWRQCRCNAGIMCTILGLFSYRCESMNYCVHPEIFRYSFPFGWILKLRNRVHSSAVSSFSRSFARLRFRVWRHLGIFRLRSVCWIGVSAAENAYNSIAVVSTLVQIITIMCGRNMREFALWNLTLRHKALPPAANRETLQPFPYQKVP